MGEVIGDKEVYYVMEVNTDAALTARLVHKNCSWKYIVRMY